MCYNSGTISATTFRRKYMQQMGRYVQVLLALFLLTITGVQAQTNGFKEWAEQHPLSWADFTGKPDAPESVYAAATYAGLALDVQDVNFAGRVTFKVRAVFDSHRSWAHPDRKDKDVLAHEQLHFDIAEVYARRLERKLNALQLKVKNKEVAKKLVLQYNIAQMKEQERYDKECVHGLNRENQQEWRTKINRELMLKRNNTKLAAARK